jgi:hypothetical protein
MKMNKIIFLSKTRPVSKTRSGEPLVFISKQNIKSQIQNHMILIFF